ncbi:uncharacterized protein LOC103391161 isoform X3 [Cynoglossus semilaevis]|uniref:uncharacterized protein LOC103391161 isoform X3 n=1 Tax=Cynoglossus semilaevis TaxID=244447 RepID=UPI000D62A7E4|nr:uncharacterized protein LOC103391161 isoform X3 [Cynoglossus semilaevis]
MIPLRHQHLQPQSFVISHRVELLYKLFLLENAKKMFERELNEFVNEAYVTVQDCLNSVLPNITFNLPKVLDKKCEEINKLLAKLKALNAKEPHVRIQPAVRKEVRTNQHQPYADKRILITDVLRFGPMLQNVLLANSIAKSVQVLAGKLSLQQLKHFLIFQPLAAQEDDTIYCISSSYKSTHHMKSLSGYLKVKEKEQCVIHAKSQRDDVILEPALIQRPEINAESLPLLLPKTNAVFPQIRNPQPMKATPLICWRQADDVQVQHQKQTSSQLLHFLRTKAKNLDAVEVTVMEWNKSMLSSCSPMSTSPTIKTQSFQFRNVPKSKASESLFANMDHKAPVFKIKQMEPSGSMTYTCVIATKTELWDVGDIFTEVRKFEETEVVVSHVVSPGNFYIQHANSSTKLQALLSDSCKASSSYAEQNYIPGIGTKVMGLFPKQEQWCRSQVTKICGVSEENHKEDGHEASIKLEVKRLDYGDTACLSLQHIRALTPEMAVLPLQAIQVSLANVTPLNGREWSEESVGWFKDMVHNRTLYARLYPHGPKVTVELFMEKGMLGAMRRSASLSVRLAQNGHANHSYLKNGSLKNNGVKKRTQISDWEKSLISCYTHNKWGQ